MKPDRRPVDPDALLKVQLEEERDHFKAGLFWGSGSLFAAIIAGGVFFYSQYRMDLLVAAGDFDSARSFALRSGIAVVLGAAGVACGSFGLALEWARWLISIKKRRAGSGTRFPVVRGPRS